MWGERSIYAFAIVVAVTACGDNHNGNTAPTIVDLTLTTDEDTPLTRTLDIADRESDDVTITFADPAHGSVQMSGADSFTYFPNANYHGPDSFAVTVSDGFLQTTGTVNIMVVSVNDSPTGIADSFATTEDTTHVAQFADLLANDSDDDGDTLTIASVGDGASGFATIVGQTVVFTPAHDFVGTGSYRYTVSDGTLTTNVFVSVSIGGVDDDPPIAIDDPEIIIEDTNLVVTGAQLVANDVDPDGQTLTVESVANPNGGTVALAAGVVTFTPTANQTGPAGFDYVVTDGVLTDTGTVHITIISVNDAPVANDDTATTGANTPVNITASSLLANDTDVDAGTTLTVMAVQNPMNGTVSLAGTTITFTPTAGFTGSASFEYIVRDFGGFGGLTDVGLVTVTVTAAATKDITAFSFLGATNPGLGTDVTASIAGTNITATVPFGTNVSALVATFTHDGTGVTIGGTAQVSGVTANDFSSPLTYRVTAQDASTQDYTVTVNFGPSPAKDITAHAFLIANNPGLTADVTATITGTNIAATVPFGTNVTALVASFTHTGASVAVGATAQVSGTTANNLTNPVTYVVSAADTTTKSYTVTVTVAADPADQKDITAFSFLAANNPGLTSDVVATITGTTITATVPGTANVTALVATFSHTGASIAIGATPQVSGVTPNDFSAAVTYTVTATNGSTKNYNVTVSIACETLANPTNGTVSVSNGGLAPSNATYACNRGYGLNGSATRSCTTGTFGGAAPTCDRKLMVLRVGDGVVAPTSASTAVFLEERSSAGALLNTYPLPTAAAGANFPFTVSGSSTTEGQLQLSTNERYVTVAGYAAAPGVLAVNGTSSVSTDVNAVARSVARIDGDGGIDTTTRMLNVFNGQSVRAVHSVDGATFYAAGNGSTGGIGGVTFMNLGSTGANTILNAATQNMTYVTIANNQLFAATSSLISTVGTGLPTTAPQTLANVLTTTTSRAFLILDRNPLVTGLDTIYFAKEQSPVAGQVNVLKFTFDGTAWTQATFTVTFTTALNTTFLAAVPEGASLRLYAVQTPASGNRIVTFVDDGSATVAATFVVAAPTNTRFFGVALAPTVAP